MSSKIDAANGSKKKRLSGEARVFAGRSVLGSRRGTPLRPGKPSPGRAAGPGSARSPPLASLSLHFRFFCNLLSNFVSIENIIQNEKFKVFQNPLPISTISPNGAQCVNFNGFVVTFGCSFFIEFRDPTKSLKMQQV